MKITWTIEIEGKPDQCGLVAAGDFGTERVYVAGVAGEALVDAVQRFWQCGLINPKVRLIDSKTEHWPGEKKADGSRGATSPTQYPEHKPNSDQMHDA